MVAVHHVEELGIVDLDLAAIPPDTFDIAVFGHQFVDLVIQIFIVGRRIIHVMLRIGIVDLGVVPHQAEAILFARIGQFAADIPLRGRPHHVVVGKFAVPHAEPVVVLGRENDIAGPGVLAHLNHGIRIEILDLHHAVELIVDIGIKTFADHLLPRAILNRFQPLRRVAMPLQIIGFLVGIFGPAQRIAVNKRARPPVDKHTETAVAPPFIIRLRRTNTCFAFKGIRSPGIAHARYAV